MNQSRMSLKERLPLDFQFLPADDKQREPDPDLRKMLIEARLAGQTFTREELESLVKFTSGFVNSRAAWVPNEVGVNIRRVQ